MRASPTPSDGLPKRAFAIVCGVQAVAAMGNTGMISVLPAIGRSIGIPDALVAAIFSLSALLWAFTSPIWARASDRRGRKPLIMLGLIGFVLSMSACALVVAAGLNGLAAPMIIFVMFLFARALFGLFGSASNPASQAYVAERTTVDQRTHSLSSLAGAFGLGTVVGPFLAPMFILPVLGLAGPMAMFALIGARMLILVWRNLPETPPLEPPEPTTVPATGAARPSPMWRDGRVRPFLIYSFLVAVCQTAQGQILGFLIIDKLALNPTAAQGFIAVAMMFGAVAGLLAQWGLIRMFEMTPRQLLRWGVGIAAAGSVMVAAAPGYWIVVSGYAVASLGFGFARPGAAAGSSLAVTMKDQARAAGALAAANGANVMLAPAFVWLYEMVAPAPFVLCAAILMGLLIYAFGNRQLRNAAPTPATRADAARATLEKSDEDGGAP
jgi:MFS family permease